MPTAVNAAARLDRLPMGPFHWRVLRLISLGMFFDGFDNTMATGILAALVASGWSTLALNANYISATFAGLAIGAVLTGILGDWLGRRFAYQFNLLLFGSMSLLSAFAPSMDWLIVLRGIMGVGIGAEYVAGYSMVSEFVPPHRRGWCLGWVALISNCAAFIAAILSVLIIPYLGWRPIYFIGGIGGLWVWYLRRKLPESPRWLEAVGRAEDAEAVMQAIESEAAPNGALPPVAASPDVSRPRIPIGILFSRAVLPRTLLAMGLNIAIVVGLYSFSSWYPSLFVAQGMSLQKSLGLSTFISFGNVCGPALILLVSDRFGRRRVLAAAAGFCAVAALIYSQQDTVVGLTILGFLLISGMTLMTALGIGCYTAELFPTEYRFRGNGVAQMTGRICVILSPYVVVALYHAFGLTAVMGSIAALYLALSIGLIVFGVETNQRSLEALAPEPAESLVPSTENT